MIKERVANLQLKLVDGQRFWRSSEPKRKKNRREVEDLTNL